MLHLDILATGKPNLYNFFLQSYTCWLLVICFFILLHLDILEIENKHSKSSKQWLTTLSRLQNHLECPFKMETLGPIPYTGDILRNMSVRPWMSQNFNLTETVNVLTWVFGTCVCILVYIFASNYHHLIVMSHKSIWKKWGWFSVLKGEQVRNHKRKADSFPTIGVWYFVWLLANFVSLLHF